MAQVAAKTQNHIKRCFKMAQSIFFNDGSVEYLFHEADTPEFYDDFQKIIYEKLGREAENIVIALRKNADYTAQKVNTDLTSYEGQLESNTTAFQEILQVCLEIKNELNFSKRLNRQVLTEFVQQIQKIINNQI